MPHFLFASITALLIATQPGLSTSGALRGQVLDPGGQPMADVQVSVLEIIDGDYRITQTQTASAEGKFSFVVPPGRIVLVAQPRTRIVGDQPTKRRFVTHPPAYFPGVLDRSDAWPIDVRPGEIVELELQMPHVSVGSIKTLLTGPKDYALEYVRVTRPEANQLHTVKLSDDGVGYTDGLREGRYIVSARGKSRDGRLAAWQVAQMVSGELVVALNLEPAAQVYGRIISERDALPPLSGTRVIAAWTDGAIDLDPLARDDGAVTADGSFSIDGVFGTRVFRVAGLDAAWKVIAVRQGRSDITAGVDVAPGSVTEIVIVIARR